MAALLLDIGALDCAVLAAGVAQRAHAVRLKGRLTAAIPCALLAIGAGLLVLARAA